MSFLRKFRSLFRKRKLDAGMAEEMRLHVELQTERNLKAGMKPEDAHYAALRQFGNVASLQEQAREMWRWVGAEQWLQDVRFAARQARRKPGFTLVAVITLALGIGLNTAMFSFVNALLLRPLPFPQPEQLVKLHRTSQQGRYGNFSQADFRDLQREEAGFGRFAAYQVTTMTLTDSRRPVQWLRATSGLFDVLGIHPRLGRAFRPEEEIAGNHRVVLITHEVWRDQFGADRDVVGRTVRGDGETYEIIGVLPPRATDHRLFGQAGLFSPLSDGTRTDRRNAVLGILGRRDPAWSEAQGAAFIRSGGLRQAADHPAENAGSEWHSEGLPRLTISPTGKMMIFMLLGLSGCVLAITCSNLANLLLARTMERAREFAVRAALGASRAQLIRPLLLESAVLALVGGTGALLVAGWTTDWLDTVILNGGGPAFGFPRDWRVLGFAAGVSALTVLFFGMAPALFAGRVNANDTLKHSARGATTGREHRRFRSLLIVGQFAFALILLAGAGFFLRGMDNLLAQPHGWRSDRVFQGNLDLPAGSYPDGAAITAWQQRLLEHLAQIPGIESASISYGLPYLGLRGTDRYVAAGRDAVAAGREPLVMLNGITPDYFKVTGTRLVAGRAFTDADTARAPQVAVISETMARVFFGGENPLGRRLVRAGAEPAESREIVGVVADVQSFDVAQPLVPFQLYWPAAQGPRPDFMLAVRLTTDAPVGMAESIRRTVAGLDPRLEVGALMPVSRAMDLIASQMYLCRQLLAVFAGLGLLLAALGVYSVVARLVAQRTAEIGIRMALGAQVPDVLRLMLGSGVRLAVIGAVIGLAGGAGLARLLAAMLPAMQANSSWVLMAAALLLVAIAFVACWLPARRAAKVDPVIALRAE